MKFLLLATLCLALAAPCSAQTADEAPSKDDVILYLRTMHSHDMLQRMMTVQAQSMHQLFHDMVEKDTGKVPPDFDIRFKKMMDELIQGMPADEIMQAMIPAYQNHFTKRDLEAMNTFYSSPVGQKVLEQLPAVMQEGNQAAMPILSKYLTDWRERMKRELEPSGDVSPKKPDPAKPTTQK